MRVSEEEIKNAAEESAAIVALEGFEPSQAEPESDVLPLHHKAICGRAYRPFASAKLGTIFGLCKFSAKFFTKKILGAPAGLEGRSEVRLIGVRKPVRRWRILWRGGLRRSLGRTKMG